MALNDPFFKLEGVQSRVDQVQFYTHMDRSNHLCDTIFEPAELTQRDGRITRIAGKTFERVSFSKTAIKEIIFNNCIFKECLFIGTVFSHCEFHGCTFVQTNLYKVLFERTYIDPNSFKKALDQKKYQNIGVHLYQTLMNNSRASEQPEFEADARFYFLRWKRYQELYEVRMSWDKHKSMDIRKRAKIATRFLWEWLAGSGIRLRYFLASVTGIVILVTTLNFFFRQQLGLNEDQQLINTYVDSLYFTTTTLTTLGFGDITPATQIGRLFVAAQGVIGFVLFAMLASMIFRKIAP